MLVQIFRLGNEAGLSRDSLMREHVAVTETAHIQSTIDALDDYRQALMLRSPRRLHAQRDIAQARLDELHRDFATRQRGDVPDASAVGRHRSRLGNGPRAQPADPIRLRRCAR